MEQESWTLECDGPAPANLTQGRPEFSQNLNVSTQVKSRYTEEWIIGVL